MNIQEHEAGWIVSGKTWDHREQLKALGGKWDPSCKGWLLPKIDRDLLSFLPLQTCDLNRVTFMGNTFPCKEVLKELGAHWDGKWWIIDHPCTKQVILDALDDAGVDWDHYSPGCFSLNTNHVLYIEME